MTAPRKLGRRQPHPRDTHPRLQLANFLRPDALPPTPPTIDWITKVTDWPMYLNGELGDCTIAAAGHMIEAWTRYGQGTTTEITDHDVLTAYQAVSGYQPGQPDTDNGAVMQDVLNHWRKTGIGGHKILAFAELNPQNPTEVTAALHLFGHIYTGVNLPNTALTQFDNHQPWDITPDDHGLAGGHAINIGSHDTATQQFTAITWAQAQPLTQAWWNRYVEEAWVAISEEWLNTAGCDPDGIDMHALGVAYTQITGQPSPFPTPTPGPDPTPEPDPDEALATALRAHNWVGLPHIGLTHHIAQAAKAWLNAKGM